MISGLELRQVSHDEAVTKYRPCKRCYPNGDNRRDAADSRPAQEDAVYSNVAISESEKAGLRLEIAQAIARIKSSQDAAKSQLRHEAANARDARRADGQHTSELRDRKQARLNSVGDRNQRLRAAESLEIAAWTALLQARYFQFSDAQRTLRRMGQLNNSSVPAFSKLEAGYAELEFGRFFAGYQDGMKRVDIKPCAIFDLKPAVGDYGYFLCELKVISVVDARNAIVSLPGERGELGTRVWLDGAECRGWTNDAPAFSPHEWKIVGTRQYTTAIGGSATVLYARRIDFSGKLLPLPNDAD